jgi:hypothetical protein
MKSGLSGLVLLVMIVFAAGCGGGGGGSGSSITITSQNDVVEKVTASPEEITVSAGSKFQLTAVVDGMVSDNGVSWQVDGGSISPEGLFTAPSSVGVFTAVATSRADSSKTASVKINVTAATGTIVLQPQLPQLAWQERPGWVNVKTSSLVSPKAKGDGVADDTKALQAALNLLESNGKDPKAKVIYIPPGTYKITSELALGDTDSAQVIGAGRDTVIFWGGPAPDRAKGFWPVMFRSIYARQMEYTGIVWDGRGMAEYGVAHSGSNKDKGDKQFEAKNVYRFMHFKNFRSAGILAGSGDNGPASSEQEYRDSIFENNGTGVYVCGSNFYNHVVSNSDFYDNDVAISMTYFGHGYTRRNHFERSRIADLVSSDPSFSFSVRHSTSIGSRRFYEPTGPKTKYQIQNAVVEGWTNMSGAISEWDPSPQALFDIKFVNPPSSFAPLYFTRQNSDPANRKILSNITSPDTSSISATQAGVSAPLTVARTAPASQLSRSDISFRTTELDVSGKVFDCKAYIQADGSPSDHTSSVQKCINAAAAEGNGAVAYFQPGDYNLEDTLVISGGGYSVEGTGFNSNLTRRGSKKSPLVEVRSPQGISIRRISAYFVGEGMTGIRQIRSGSGTSSVTYDQVNVHPGRPVLGNPQYAWQLNGVKYVTNFDGMLLEGLSTGDKVNIKRLNGAIRINNCGRATILGEFLDGLPLIVEGNETVRDGFIGFLNVNGGSLQVRDNQNIVIGDFYTEQSGDWDSTVGIHNVISLTGSSGTPSGSAVIGMAKYHAHDTDNLLTVGDYQGFVSVSFPYYNTGDRPSGKDGTPFTLTHSGSSTVDILLLGHDSANYNFLETGSGATVYKYPASSSGSSKVATAFDRLAEMGAVDLTFNPQRTLGVIQTPTIAPVGGRFYQPTNVQIRTATGGAKIRYTTDGTEPSSTNGTEVANGSLINIASTRTLKAIAVKSGYADSPSVGSSFVISSDAKTQTVWPDSKKATGSIKAGSGEYGQTFTPTVDGYVTAVRVYGLAKESGLHKARIYKWGGFEDTSGTVLAGPFDFTYGGSDGWVTLNIPPLKVLKDTLYIVSVSTGTDADGLVPVIEGDSDLLSPTSNGVNLIRPKNSAGYPIIAGAVKRNFLRDVVFVPSQAYSGNTTAAVPATPVAPGVAESGTKTPIIYGTADPGVIVHVLPRSTLNGNDGTVPPISVKVPASGAWAVRLSNMPVAKSSVTIMHENARGLSTASPSVEFTVSN